jgi:hypothetical protein
VFASLEDHAYYDNDCEAHKTLRASVVEAKSRWMRPLRGFTSRLLSEGLCCQIDNEEIENLRKGKLIKRGDIEGNVHKWTWDWTLEKLEKHQIG